VRAAVRLSSLLVFLVASPAAHATTYVTVDGHPDPVTLTVGEPVTTRWDTAEPGGTVPYTLTRDLSGVGNWDPAHSDSRTTAATLPCAGALSGSGGTGGSETWKRPFDRRSVSWSSTTTP
jgi:hypothetical protein